MLCSPVPWRFLGMGSALRPSLSPTPVCQSGGGLQHFHEITYFMKFDLPVSQILSLHQVQKLGVEQLSCFSGDVRSRWKQINWIVRRCIVRWWSSDTMHWNTGIRSAEKCRILWKFKECFPEHSDIMSVLTSVAPIPYLSNMSISTGSPDRCHEGKLAGVQHVHISASRCISEQDAEYIQNPLKIQYFQHWKYLYTYLYIRSYCFNVCICVSR